MELSSVTCCFKVLKVRMGGSLTMGTSCRVSSWGCWSKETLSSLEALFDLLLFVLLFFFRLKNPMALVLVVAVAVVKDCCCWSGWVVGVCVSRLDCRNSKSGCGGTTHSGCTWMQGAQFRYIGERFAIFTNIGIFTVSFPWKGMFHIQRGNKRYRQISFLRELAANRNIDSMDSAIRPTIATTNKKSISHNKIMTIKPKHNTLAIITHLNHRLE